MGVRRCDRRGRECIKDGRPFSKPRPSRGLPHAHGQAPAAGGHASTSSGRHAQTYDIVEEQQGQEHERVSLPVPPESY